MGVVSYWFYYCFEVGSINCSCFNWKIVVANIILAYFSILAWEIGIRVELLIDGCIDCLVRI